MGIFRLRWTVWTGRERAANIKHEGDPAVPAPAWGQKRGIMKRMLGKLPFRYDNNRYVWSRRSVSCRQGAAHKMDFVKREEDRMVVDILCGLMCLYIAMGMAWRMICLFRKNGSCKFRRCPFRRDYTNTSCVYVPPGGCTKCPPTEEERAIYEHSVYGIVESMTKKQN